MKRHGFDVSCPLSFYQSTGFMGTRYIVKGMVQRAYISRYFGSGAVSSKNENEWTKGVTMSIDKSDSSGLFVRLHGRGKNQPWEKNDMKSRYFVVSDRYIYELQLAVLFIVDILKNDPHLINLLI